MERDEWRAFLVEGTRTAKLATTRADGRPHVVPIWFLLDGDDVVFTTWHESLKARSLRRDPRVALCVDDDRPPFAYVELGGRATLSDDLDEVRAWATRLGRRYMGAERGEEFGARNGVPGELLVRVHVDHVVAVAAVAS
jgi:PPOX class probable F420-dependent enzyme